MKAESSKRYVVTQAWIDADRNELAVQVAKAARGPLLRMLKIALRRLSKEQIVSAREEMSIPESEFKRPRAYSRRRAREAWAATGCFPVGEFRADAIMEGRIDAALKEQRADYDRRVAMLMGYVTPFLSATQNEGVREFSEAVFADSPTGSARRFRAWKAGAGRARRRSVQSSESDSG